MKKVLSIVAVAGVAMFASCGNAAELKRLADSVLKADSIRVADSTMQAAQHIKDSITNDSMNNVAKMAKMMDSLKQDSINNAGKKKGK